MMNAALRSSPADLAQRLVELEARLAAAQTRTQTLVQELQALRQENQLLRQKIEALIRRYFGSPKNEGLDPNQLQLLLAGLVAQPTPPPPPPPAPAPARSPRAPAHSGLPDNLPVVEVRLLPPEVQAHPEQFRQIGTDRPGVPVGLR